MTFRKIKFKKGGLPREAKRSGGFTLVEMLIAVSLFIVVITISIGAILSIFDANKKAQTSKTVVDNLNLAIEDMARTVRFGGNYHCGNSGSLASAQDCASNQPDQGSDFLAVTFEGDVVVFRLNGTAIQKSTDGGFNYTNITAPEAKIQHLKFYVFGSSSVDSVQPHIIAVIKGYVGEKQTTQTSFNIQTTMSQRTLDI